MQKVYLQREKQRICILSKRHQVWFACYSVLAITFVMTMNKLRLLHQICLQIISHPSAVQLLLPWPVFTSWEQEHVGPSDRQLSKIFQLETVASRILCFLHMLTCFTPLNHSKEPRRSCGVFGKMFLISF